MSDIIQADADLNAHIAAGKIIDGFQKHYHDDVEMQENLAPPMKGKAANLEREKGFWGGAKLEKAELLASAVTGDHSYSEWSIDVTLGNGYNLKLHQVAARTWRDGKVVHERFYYDPKAAA
jgi:hypothetical protein